MHTIYQKFQIIANRFASKIAIIDCDRSYDYQSILTYIKISSEKLATLAPKLQPRVALVAENAKDLFSITMAVAKLGGVCVPTNPQLTEKQFQDSWQATDTNMVIYDANLAIKLPSQSDGILFVSIQELQNISNRHNTANLVPKYEINPEQDFLITLSSGSTGDPKPIALSQAVKIKRAHQTRDLYNLTFSDVVLCASPFYHSLGQRLFFVPLLLGATLVYMKKFTPKKWLSAVCENQVSFIICVSSHLYALKDYLLNKSEHLKSIKTIVTSSAPIDENFKLQLFESIGCDFHEIYGATEIATATNLAPSQAVKQHQTVGKACNNVVLKILDEDRNEVSVNTLGEIAVKTPLAFNGYYKKQELTNQAMHNGFFLTGDIGKLNQQGFLTYVSRKKDIIISGGINIYPKDIEDVLLKHPGISEVAVIGLQDKLLGEVVIAVCICTNNEKNEQALYRLANQNLSAYQRPLKYFFQDSLPLTNSGKISKLALKEKYNALNYDLSAPLRAMFYTD